MRFTLLQNKNQNISKTMINVKRYTGLKKLLLDETHYMVLSWFFNSARCFIGVCVLLITGKHGGTHCFYKKTKICYIKKTKNKTKTYSLQTAINEKHRVWKYFYELYSRTIIRERRERNLQEIFKVLPVQLSILFRSPTPKISTCILIIFKCIPRYLEKYKFGCYYICVCVVIYTYISKDRNFYVPSTLNSIN